VLGDSAVNFSYVQVHRKDTENAEKTQS